jgi:hypothetical protein
VNLIDETYFIGPLTIAQLGHKPTVDSLRDYITVGQEQLLQAAMGYELYKDFMAGLDVGSDEVVEQKWLDILNGVEFTSLYDRLVKWQGFQPEVKLRAGPLTNYVFFNFVRSLNTQQTGTGTAQSKTQNAVQAPPDFKTTDAWNNMVDQIWLLWEFLRVNADTYPQFNLWDVAGMRIWSFWPYYRTTGGRIVFRKTNAFSI